MIATPAIIITPRRTGAGAALTRMAARFAIPVSAAIARSAPPPGRFCGRFLSTSARCAVHFKRAGLLFAATLEVKMGRAKCRPDPRQMDFMALLGASGVIPVPASADLPAFEGRMRRTLTDAIKTSGLGRGEIAALTTSLCGREITKPMIDCWSGASRPHHLPAAMIPPLCHALRNTMLIEALTQECGCHIITGAEVRLARIGQRALYRALADEDDRADLDALTAEYRGGASSCRVSG